MHLCNGLIQWNSGSKFSLRACHYQDELSFWGVIPIESGSLCQGSAADLLVELGQLPTQGDTAVRAEGGGEVLQRGEELVGSLVKEYGALFPPQGFQPLPAVPPVDGEKALEHEAAGRQAADCQGTDASAAAGDRDMIDTKPEICTPPSFSGITSL